MTKRQPQDFYPTPERTFKVLLPYLNTLQVWEPAAGDGRLINWLRDYGIEADGNDINTGGYNFLTDTNIYPCIITNPPYSLALYFADKALKLSTEVYLLLRLNFLASQTRHKWWKQHTPNCLFILSERPKFINNKSDSTEYAWFYWGARHSGIKFLI